MAEARSVKWKTMKKQSFILLHPDADSLRHDAITKDAFIGALEDKELTLHVMEREPKSLEEAFKIAERVELYARKVKPEGKNGFESKLKVLVICSSFIVTLNQDCYKLPVIILRTLQAMCIFLLL